MKLYILLLATFLICGNQKLDSTVQFDDFVGEYKVYKTELIEEYSNGWNYSRRYERTLILYPDSTYDEINLSFEAFDYPDEFGKWNMKNGQLILTPSGNLDYKEGSFKRIVQPNKESQLEEQYLQILSKKELKILEDGFLKNEQLIKQVTTKPKTN